MFHKIMVCTDGSSWALDAVRAASDIAEHQGAELIALNVFHRVIPGPGDIVRWPIEVAPAGLDECSREERETIEQQIAPIFDRMATPHRVLQEIGHPVKTILCAAERENADLIVVGSRGLRGIKGFLLGSVSHAVMHQATCPVLVVRCDRSSTSDEPFQHILLASDGSQCAQNAVAEAVDMTKSFSTSLTVLNVCTDLSSVIAPDEAEVIEEEEQLIGDYVPDLFASRVLESVRKNVRGAAKEAGIYCSYIQKKGDPCEIIVRYAEQHHLDLIVLGSSGMGGFKQMLVGSVSNYVAHNAACSVLVVR